MLKFRLYLDKDLEEEWLNKMSANGWAFKKFRIGFYTFEKCEPGEYDYQIDLLDNWHGDKEDFASFMEESGVEVISQWYRWVFIRKKATGEPFEMYTDAESKIALYSRISRFFLIALIAEAFCLFIELRGALEPGGTVFWVAVLLIGAFCLALLRMIWKCKWKVDQLQRERNYR